MTINVALKMDSANAIILKRGLQYGGPVQMFFTSEIARMADPYVPMDTGALKNTVQTYPARLVYPQIYSRTQYVSNKGKGKRGKEWIPRMWNDRGKAIVRSVADYAGLKSK